MNNQCYTCEHAGNCYKEDTIDEKTICNDYSNYTNNGCLTMLICILTIPLLAILLFSILY